MNRLPSWVLVVVPVLLLFLANSSHILRVVNPLFPGLVLVVVGIALAIFRTQFIRSNVRMQREFFNFHISEEAMKTDERNMLIAGPIVALFGLKLLMGVHLNLASHLTDNLYRLFFVAVGVLMIFSGKSVGYFATKGQDKPLQLHIGGRDIELGRLLVVLVGVLLVVTGLFSRKL